MTLKEQKQKGREIIIGGEVPFSLNDNPIVVKVNLKDLDQQTVDTWKAAQEAVSITQLLEILDDRYQQLNREND
jgi:hypothetical protein